MLESGQALACETARRLGCDSALVGILERTDEAGVSEVLDVGRKTRAIPPAIKRALKARDQGCRFPGCDRTRYTEGHHVEHWADGGETKLSNLVSLRHFHHHLVHEGGYGIEASESGESGGFVFTRPDGSQIPTNGAQKCFRGSISKAAEGRSAEFSSFASDDSGSRADEARAQAARPGGQGDVAHELVELNRGRGLAIDAETCRTRWLDESMDYNTAIDALVYAGRTR